MSVPGVAALYANPAGYMVPVFARYLLSKHGNLKVKKYHDFHMSIPVCRYYLFRPTHGRYQKNARDQRALVKMFYLLFLKVSTIPIHIWCGYDIPFKEYSPDS